MDESSMIDDFDDCEVADSSNRRWYLVAVVGTPLSLISLFSNLLIARAVLSQKRNHFFFLGVLALSDSFLSLSYGPVIAMDVIKNRIRWYWLSWLWWSYVGPMLALCHISMTFSCFMIILATIERYLITQKSRFLDRFRDNRGYAVIAMFLVAVVVRGTAIFEIQIVHKENCTDFAEYEPTLTPLVSTWLYGTVFRFYFRNIVTVFIPFFLLAYLNMRIVFTLRGQQRRASLLKFTCNVHKRRVRSATRLTVFIVCSYLMANVLNVLITAWEYIDFESAQTEDTFWIYETCADVISVLYVFTCATRLLIYLTCNKEIRDIILPTLRSSNRLSTQHRKSVSAAFREPRETSDFDRIAISVARRLTLVNVLSNKSITSNNKEKYNGDSGEDENSNDDGNNNDNNNKNDNDNINNYDDNSDHDADDDEANNSEHFNINEFV